MGLEGALITCAGEAMPVDFSESISLSEQISTSALGRDFWLAVVGLRIKATFILRKNKYKNLVNYFWK